MPSSGDSAIAQWVIIHKASVYVHSKHIWCVSSDAAEANVKLTSEITLESLDTSGDCERYVLIYKKKHFCLFVCWSDTGTATDWYLFILYKVTNYFHTNIEILA